jgi:hypothetical protein
MSSSGSEKLTYMDHSSNKYIWTSIKAGHTVAALHGAAETKKTYYRISTFFLIRMNS